MIGYRSFAVFGLVLAHAGCAPGPSTPAASNAQTVDLQLMDGAGIDFGTVPEGKILKARFRLRNAGCVPITLDPLISKSCGCTEATLLKSQLAPGDTAELHSQVTAINTRGQSRHVTATVNVKSPEGIEPLVFTMAFSATARWIVTPAEIRVAGYAGEPVSANFTVRTFDSSLQSQPNVVTTAPNASVEITPSEEERATSIDVQFRCPAEPGVKPFTVTVGHTADTTATLVATIICRTQDPLRIQPALLTLTRSENTTDAEYIGQVTVESTRPAFPIERLNLSPETNPALATEIEQLDVEGKTGWILRFRCRPDDEMPRLGSLQLQYSVHGNVTEAAIPYLLRNLDDPDSAAASVPQ